MQTLGIVLGIIGAVVAIISGLLWLSATHVTNSKKNWQEFIEEGAKKGLNYPEDVIWNLTIKIKNSSCFICICSLLIVLTGILLIISI